MFSGATTATGGMKGFGGRAGVLCAAVLSLASMAHAQTIKKGPFGYNMNGHRYVMIQATSWEQARTWARARGGDLATINDAAEDAWVFGAFNPGGYKYMLGLAAVDTPGTLTWSDGSTSTYRNWAASEPNTSATQKYVTVQNDAKWYVRQTAFSPYYIVEWNAGPIKVPSEYATLEEAFNAMSATGVKDLQIAAGTYILNNSVGAWVNYTQMGTITGAGQGQTNIITRVNNNAAIILTGKWTIRDLKITRDFGQAALSLNEAPAFMENCVLDGDNSDASWSLVLYGATGASLSADRCTFLNTGSLFGSIYPTYGYETVTNSVFANVGTITWADAPGTFSNCTIFGGTTGADKFGGPAQLYNSIVWNMNGQLGNAVAFNCNIQQAGVTGIGNINVDPKFVPGSFSLAADSPCIDAGSTTRMLGNGVDAAGLARVSGAAPDMGAFEYQQTPPPVCGADFDGDGFITFEDFDAFVAAFEAGC
jgi:hypothetical protein